MDCVARAFCYIRRKKIKTILLLFLFLVINSMVLGTLGMRAVSFKLEEELRKNAESKVTLESVDVEQPFEETDMLVIEDIPNINWINRSSEIKAVSFDCIPVFGNETSEDMFYIHGYDKLENDSPFTDKVCRLVSGSYPQEQEEIVLNQFLAEDNGIWLGDRITLETVNKIKQEVTVVGLFLTGMERNQTENVETVNRIENQIYGTTNFVNTLSGNKRFLCATVYVNDPEQLEVTEDTLKELYKDRAAIGINNHTFQKLRLMTMQTGRITLLIFILTVIVGCSVTGILLAMWMRSRKTEIAVLVSLGISKKNILAQMLLEGGLLYAVAFVGAGIVTKFILPQISSNLDIMWESGITLELSFDWTVIILGIGLVSIIILTGIAIFPYMKKPVKEILSEMEE